MKWHRRQGVLTVAVAAFLCAGPMGAQTAATGTQTESNPAPPPPPDGAGPHRGGPEHRLQMLEERLSLTADQTTQAKAIFAAERTKMDALRSNSALSSEDRRSQMMAIHQEEDTRFRGLLTAEQATKYDAMEAHMREHRHEGGPPQGPPPPPGY